VDVDYFRCWQILLQKSRHGTQILRAIGAMIEQ
jgi:hypothetical protein